MGYDLGPLGHQSALTTVLIAVGALSLASIVYTVGRVLLSTFILPGQSVSKDLKYSALHTDSLSSPRSGPEDHGQW